uniref:Uncharacterized protein n=1 Tax=Oncorhynchus tshawytscha TaxID=74940 RepID=A0A8C8F3S3_ONCTS
MVTLTELQSSSGDRRTFQKVNHLCSTPPNRPLWQWPDKIKGSEYFPNALYPLFLLYSPPPALLQFPSKVNHSYISQTYFYMKTFYMKSFILSFKSD